MITQQARPPVRMLIAGVGYQHLRDMSLGPVVIAQLQQEPWPPGVDLADLSYGPIAVMHSLDDLPAYDRIIFVAGVSRARQPGRVDCYQWQHVLPDREEIQARVAEKASAAFSMSFRSISAKTVMLSVEIPPVTATLQTGMASAIARRRISLVYICAHPHRRVW
jgi:Ni,Fe-hydrogenase maturation factor